MKTKTFIIALFFVKIACSAQDSIYIPVGQEELCLYGKWEQNSPKPSTPLDEYPTGSTNDNFQNRHVTAKDAVPLLLDTPKFTVDSSHRIIQNDSNYIPPERFKTRLPQALYIPGALIILGFATVGDNGIYNRYDARNDLLKATGGKGGPVDDYLIWAPYVEFGALLLLNVKCRNDFVNTALLIAKSEALMLALTYTLKYSIKEERPYSYQKGLDGVPLDVRKQDKQAFLSMPSGHTSEAFVAATIVYREYRYLSPWYGIGSYALATTVGLYRMINDQHWMSDVLVGAGIGILSANVVYATHQHRWGRNEVCLVPLYNGVYKGFSLSYNFN